MTDRRSWLDKLLKRSGTPEVTFEPAGSKLDDIVLPISFAIVPGRNALDIVRKLHAEKPESHAFILGSAEDAQSMFEIYEDSPDAVETLKIANSLTVDAWLAEEQEHLEKIRAEHPELADEPDPQPERGEWPDGYGPQAGFSGHVDILTGDYKDQVYIGLSPAPVERWWDTAAHLRIGNWNDCPGAEVHVILHKIWAEKYGARLVTMSLDTIELLIENPITNREEAMEIAMLQYQYCNDVVDQGAETLENLAASLIGATSWYFWWD